MMMMIAPIKTTVLRRISCRRRICTIATTPKTTTLTCSRLWRQIQCRRWLSSSDSEQSDDIGDSDEAPNEYDIPPEVEQEVLRSYMKYLQTNPKDRNERRKTFDGLDDDEGDEPDSDLEKALKREEDEHIRKYGYVRSGRLTDDQYAEYMSRLEYEGPSVSGPAVAAGAQREWTSKEKEFDRFVERSRWRREHERRRLARHHAEAEKARRIEAGLPEEEPAERRDAQLEAANDDEEEAPDVDDNMRYLKPRIDTDKSLSSYINRGDEFADTESSKYDKPPFDFAEAKMTEEPPTMHNFRLPKVPDVKSQLYAKDTMRPDGTLPYYAKVKLRLRHVEPQLIERWAAKWREKLKTLVTYDAEGAATQFFNVPGFVRMPTRRKRWTLLSSPFVHKKARVQLERATHQRLVTAEASGKRNRLRQAVSLVEQAVHDQSDFGNSQEVDTYLYRKHIGYFRLKYKD